MLFLHFLPVAKLMGIIQQELIKCHYCPLFWYWVIHFSSPTNGTVSVRIFYTLSWHILPSIYLDVWNLIPDHRCCIEVMECLSSLTSLCLLCYMPSGCYEPWWIVEWMFLDSFRQLKTNSICKVLCPPSSCFLALTSLQTIGILERAWNDNLTSRGLWGLPCVSNSLLGFDYVLSCICIWLLFENVTKFTGWHPHLSLSLYIYIW